MENRYLFRAKRIVNGEWIIGNLIDYKDGRSDIAETSGDWMIREVDPSTICQCTGIKDKNGNMVFENDIMSAHLDDIFPEDITYARVTWEDTGFCLREKESIDIQHLEENDMKYFAVCGNIFDNPELLEQED